MAALYFMWVNEYISQQCLIDYDSHQHSRLYGELFYKNHVTILPEMSYDYLLVKKNGILMNRHPLIWVNKIHCIYLSNEIWVPDIKVLGCMVNYFANYYVHLSISPTRSYDYMPIKNMRPIGHIAYLRNQFKSRNTIEQSYDYI